mgnify:CR=1 FL=1
MDTQTTKEKQMNEAIKNGLQSFREATETAKTLDSPGFDDPNLYSVPSVGGGVKTAGVPQPVATGNEVNAASVAAKPSDAVGSPAGVAPQDEEEKEVKEDTAEEEITTAEYLAELLDGDGLSEEFMDKLVTIFETALTDRINHIEAEMQNTFTAALTEKVTDISEEMAEKLDEFLAYVVKEWTEENDLAIERGIKSDIAESLLSGLKDLFESHYITMPEEKVDIVENLLKSKDELESQLNEQIENNVELVNELAENAKYNIFNSNAYDLTDTQIERFAELVENVDFESVEQYDRKLKIIKESFMNSKTQEINEEVSSSYSDLTETTHQSGMDPMMEAYTRAIGFQNRNNS